MDTYHSYCEAKYIVGFWMKISLIMLPEELDNPHAWITCMP